MTLDEIKQAIAEGRKVYHHNKNYEVIQDGLGRYMVVSGFNGYTVGLGKTLNGKEEDFFSETPRELREMQTHALIVDMMENPRPEDLHKIYSGLEHYFAKNCTGEEVANLCRDRTKI
jgi:hypothetical protein